MLDEFGIPHDFSMGKPQYINQVIGAPVCYCVWWGKGNQWFLGPKMFGLTHQLLPKSQNVFC